MRHKIFIIFHSKSNSLTVCKDMVYIFHRKFPNIIGAIDGCHIKISPKQEERVAYYNFKHYHSVHLQAVCLYDRRFSDIFVGYGNK